MRQTKQREFCMNHGQPNRMHCYGPYKEVIKGPHSKTMLERTGVRRGAHHRILSTWQHQSVTLPRSAGGRRWWYLAALDPRTMIEEH